MRQHREFLANDLGVMARIDGEIRTEENLLYGTRVLMFGSDLQEFFANPPGTMALVLSSQIVLTPDEKKDVIRRLEAAFEANKALGDSAAH